MLSLVLTKAQCGEEPKPLAELVRMATDKVAEQLPRIIKPGCLK